jgi:RNA polymerase sigma factor (sigma-70 family)
VAAAACLAIAREAKLRTDIDRESGERDRIIHNANRLWRLLDEHADASADARRMGMVRMLEEELGATSDTLDRLRVEIAPERARAMCARETMTQANLALVVHVAKNYQRRGVPMADLIQEGNISLVRAVERFDPEHGTRLGTYATAWLHRSIRRAVRTLGRTVRLPESAKNAQSHSVPIDEPVGQERLSLTDVLCEDDAIAPDDLAAREQVRSQARELLEGLSPQEAVVVRRRFGIEQDHAETLREIGEVLGVTRERVRQIEKLALDKLRRRLRHLAPE